MIAVLAERFQLIVVSHARTLVDAMALQDGTSLVSLEKQLGETVLRDTDPRRWRTWPSR